MKGGDLFTSSNASIYIWKIVHFTFLAHAKAFIANDDGWISNMRSCPGLRDLKCVTCIMKV